MSKLFSIVIPTRNRLETAYYAVRTCLFDPSDDYEVIVFDNASEIAVTFESLEIDDPRVVIHRSEQTLPMFQSWETALSHATGEYVIVIGDDDGLLPGTLPTLRQLIPRHPGLPIRWSFVSYHWPSHLLPLKRDRLKIPLSNAAYLLDSRAAIKAVTQFRLQYWALPMLYNAAVPRVILERIRQKCGQLFLSTCPDVASGLAIAHECETYLSLECPLTISGASGKSNGVANLSAANTKETASRPVFVQEFAALNRAHGVVYPHPSLPALTIMPIVTASSFQYVREKLFPEDNQLRLDLKQVVQACLDDILSRPAPEAKPLLATLKEFVQTKTSLAWQDPYLAETNDVLGNQPQGKPTPLGYDESEKTLILDTAQFAVQDVHAASLLAEKVLAYQRQGFRLTIKTPQQNLIASGRKFLSDLLRRRKIPAMIDCD